MKNLDLHEWSFSKGEKYAIRWLESHGFDVTLNKRHISVDVFTVSKDGITDTFRLPLGDSKINYRKVMEQFERNFSMLTELTRLRQEAKVKEASQNATDFS